VALIARLATQERFASLVFTPRGGGTGTNGQALNQGIIVDMSRYMNRIIEINPEEGGCGSKRASSKISLTSISSRTATFLPRSFPPATARPLAG
jgi:hypothetical protein